MTRYDRIIFAAVLALALVIAALSVASARLGPTVDGMSTAQLLDGVLVNSQVAITFTQPMRIGTVQHAFHIVPGVRGDFSWSGNQMRFVPQRSLAYGTHYRVTVSTAAEDSTGRPLGHGFSGTFTTQQQHLMYMDLAGERRNRLVLASIGGKKEVMGSDDGLVTTFAASFDRSLVVYVKRGGAKERANEVWLLSLADGSSQRIIRQPEWDITQPHFSPNNRYIVFLASNVRLCRAYYGCSRDTRPEIYLFDLRSRRTFPFRSPSDVPITNFIDFSPHGQLAYTDLGSALTLADPGGSNVVHIPNSGNSLEYQGFNPPGDKAVFVGATPSSTGGDILVYSAGKYIDVSHGVYDSSTPSFSTSGSQVAYSAYRGERGIEPIYGINISDLKTGHTSRLTAEPAMSDWMPRWSPGDQFIAFIRSQPQEPMYMGSGEIWVARSDGRDARPLGAVGSGVQWVE